MALLSNSMVISEGTIFPYQKLDTQSSAWGKYLLHESFNHLASLGATFRLCTKQIACRW